MNHDADLDVAVAANWQGDAADVSFNAITRMAGLSRPSPHRSFGSEDALAGAGLDRYARAVLSEIFGLLYGARGLLMTLDRVIDFASNAHRMKTRCLFYKRCAGRHLLGLTTRARIDDRKAAARAACADFVQSCREARDWQGALPVPSVARYLGEQIALAVTLRPAGTDKTQSRDMLTLALSVLRRP